MLRIQHWNKALELIKGYYGATPLHHYLKQYFSENKKHGSRDRKTISHLCYSYYRLGWCLKAAPAEDRLKIAVLLTQNDLSPYSEVLGDELLRLGDKNFSERIAWLEEKRKDFSADDLFPFRKELSAEVDFDGFKLSHLQQPDVFVRIRPGKEDIVAAIVKGLQMEAVYENPNCLRLPPWVAVDQLFAVNRDVVVQDYSSQRVGEFLKMVAPPAGGATRLWDCCAASGGKSLLAIDVMGKIELTVSDLRPSIIQNLVKRFREAGVSKFKSFSADLSQPSDKLPKSKFDLVICDAPCSGSGTWGRTPEQLYFFSPEKIQHYAGLQKGIARTAAALVKEGGSFLYVTCSVFEDENKKMVEWLQTESGLRLVREEMLKGWEKKADTMFAALLRKG